MRLTELQKAKNKATGQKPKPDNYDSKKAEMLRETVPTAVVVAPACPCEPFTQLLAKGCAMLQQLAQDACRCEHHVEAEVEAEEQPDEPDEPDDSDDPKKPPDKVYR